MATSTTTVTFLDEEGNKAIATVIVDRAEGSIDLKINFEPPVKTEEKSDRIMLLNLFVKAMTGDECEVESVKVIGTNDD